MNALSLELRWELQAALEEIGADPEVGVVVLTGAGEACCSGLDLKEMGSPVKERSAVQPKDPPSLLREVNKPIIGAINGAAITGGFEISLSCDLLVITPETRFADTHARIGLIAGWGLGARLSRAVGLARAKAFFNRQFFICAAGLRVGFGQSHRFPKRTFADLL